METGISIYLSQDPEAQAALVERSGTAGVRYAFTSLHIPEEAGVDYRTRARQLLALCHGHGIALIADIAPATLKKLGCENFEELRRLGVEYVRLDDGFDATRTVELSGIFHVVFNASTISETDIVAWRAADADFSRFAACHNFYPKPLTGLAVEDVAAMNARLKALGFQVMGFVPGDRDLRGPLHEGLPTVEAHRGDTGGKLALDMLELGDAGCDVVLLGDPGASPELWQRMAEISSGCLGLHAELDAPFRHLFGRIQHERPDSSPWIVRSQESRLWDDVPEPPSPQEHPGAEAQPGDILMSTTAYGRYAGELEIARKRLALDGRDVRIGQVAAADLPFLPFIRRGAGFRFVEA